MNSVAFHPHRDELVSFSYDGTIKVWDLAARDAVPTLRGHGAEVRALAVSADGR